MYLGALIKSLRLDLFEPFPVAPFTGYSMLSLDDAILEIDQLPFDKVCPQSKQSCSNCHDLRTKSRNIVFEQYMNIKGLELKEFFNLPK